MSNIFKFILIFIFITNCSSNQSLKFWPKDKKIKQEDLNTKKIFKEEKSLDSEFNPSLKIILYSKEIDNSFKNNNNNNNGRINYNGNLESISKFKFSKIKNFHMYEPNILINNDNIIFFNNKGSILKFDNNSKLIWKSNNYSKNEKKQTPILSFANNKNILIIADNLGKYYALNITNGKLLWSQNNPAPFNSQIKIYKDKFFVIDFENVLRAFRVIDGKEVWKIKTEKSLIRSQKQLSIIIVNKKIYFNNSLGDISSVDMVSGELIWQKPTQNSLIYDEQFSLKTSDLIADNNNLYFSNNKNQFFSLNLKNGTYDWTHKINSDLRPTLIDGYIFTITKEGFMVVIEKKKWKHNQNHRYF